jgi:hypothetical protein
MPADEGGGLHNGQGLAPVKPAREPDQGKAGSIGGTARFDVALLVEGQLFTQKEVFRCEYRRWTQTEAQETDDIDQQRQQRTSETQYIVE